MEEKKSIFYSFDKLLSYNAMLNFVIGERGVGKSYNALCLVIRDFIKNGNEFVYLRRYKTELKSSVPKIFDALIANDEFNDHRLSVKNGVFYCDGVAFGYPIALSTANIKKSTSYAKVKTIIFDEFLLASGSSYHYLSNEPEVLLDLIETVARLRDVRVLLLGNAISISNPYFEYFKIGLPYNSEFKTFKDGLIVVNYIKNQAYRDEKRNTKFGRLIDGTKYGEYAIDNQMLQDSDSFILKKTEHCKSVCTLILNGVKYGVWRDFKLGFTFVSLDVEPNNPSVFALEVDDHNEHTQLVNARKNNWMKIVIESFKMGCLYFESIEIKNRVLSIIVKCLSF